MIHYINFLFNVFELFYIFNDLNGQCFFIDKNLIKDIIDLIIIVKYTIYAYFKYLSIKIHYYYLMIYTIFVLPHITFVSSVLKYFYIIKSALNSYVRYLKYWSKIRKWWKTYYRFHRIYNFKIVFFFMFVYLFILMWKRRRTYLKLGFFLRLFFFYILSLYLSDIFVVLFNYSIIGHLLALILSLLIVYMTLN